MTTYSRKEWIPNGIINASVHHLTDGCEIHQHDFFEIEYILGGHGEYIQNGRPHPLTSGDIFLMSPADFHELHPSGEGVRLINIAFTRNPNIGEVLFRLFSGGGAFCHHLTGGDDALVRMIAEEIVSGVQKDEPHHAFKFLTALLSKFDMLIVPAGDGTTDYVKSAVLYMLENFTSPLTLEAVAKQIGLSPKYLSEIFCREVGVSFKKYLDNLRFDYASNILRYSNASVAEVYEKSGFSDYSNFSKRFRERFGMSPSQYRKLNRS